MINPKITYLYMKIFIYGAFHEDILLNIQTTLDKSEVEGVGEEEARDKIVPRMLRIWSWERREKEGWEKGKKERISKKQRKQERG